MGVTLGVTHQPIQGVTPMPLTDVVIRKAKPESKTVRMFHEKGLYLEIASSGRRNAFPLGCTRRLA